MKISKVDHIKTGVSELPIESGGMMYYYPGSNSKNVELRKHITQLCNRARNLYNVFVEPKAAKGKSLDKEICNTLNFYFKNYILKRVDDGNNDDGIYNNICTRNFNARPVMINFKEVNVTEINVQNVIDRCLRQSLRKKFAYNEKTFFIPDVIKKIGIVVFAHDKYLNEIKNISKDEAIALIKALREDYTKENMVETVAASIEKQNVPVQISKDGEQLVLSGSFNEKKAYIFEFMKKYASDEKGQDELLKHMRYLMLLYFYGKDTADDALNDDRFGAWNYGITLNEYKEILFSGEAADIRAELDNVPTNMKGKIRNLEDQLVNTIQKAVVAHYKNAIDGDELSDDDKKWVGFISDRVESKLLKICKSKGRDNGYKLTCKYLCEDLWDEWISFMAMKFVDMGKAVYHFAMEDRDAVTTGKTVSFGRVNSNYKNGLSSFDYERIKASDSFSRSLANYVLFAINNFDTSVRTPEERAKNKKEDILSDNSPVISDDAKKHILRFFGGASNYENTEVDTADTNTLFKECKCCLSAARNTSFHFVSGKNRFGDMPVINAIFKVEQSKAGKIYRKRMYSNNVPMFYAVKDIDDFMSSLYTSVRNDPAQIPSFNKVISRKEIYSFISEFILRDNREVLNNTEIAEIFKSSLYFVLKEIYYYDFINQKDIMDRFMKSINNLKAKDRKEQEAHNDFKKRIDQLKADGIGFGELCQEIMTEYNLQNNQKSKKPSAVKVKDKDGNVSVKEIKDDKTIYKHYVMLLYLGIRQAFYDYINEGKYAFLKKPNKRDLPDEEVFISGWTAKMYDSINLNNDVLMSWYITAHFLDQKQLNHLIGQFKTYVSYIDGIEKRAGATGNKQVKESEDNKKLYIDMITLLEFVKLYCGSVSNKIEDYFENADDYAKYIAGFVDFGGEDKNALQAFCNKKYKFEGDSVTLGKYFDAMNPILDRNVVLASMYGDRELLSAVADKVNEKEITKFYKLKEKAVEIMSENTSEPGELRKLREYQNLKNRIELVDVLSLTELTTALMSQLVGYTALRERDLMYMQLGYYYTKLFHTDSVEKDSYLRKLKGDCDIEDGAVLYQIAAMYSYDLPLYERDEDGISHAPKKPVSIGNKVKKFSEAYCRESKEAGNEYEIYKAGLNLFENISGKKDGRHDEYVDFRIYIDHLKYFAYHDMSILQMYSKLYGGFFSYSTKLRKSVSYVMPNILLSDFVNVKLGFDYKEEGMGDVTYRIPDIVIKEISSDYLSYKEFKSIVSSGNEVLKDGKRFVITGDFVNKNAKKPRKDNKPVSVPARSKSYLDAVSRLLAYRTDMK